MAETRDEALGLQRTSNGVSYYIKRDAVADTFSVVLANADEYRTNTGTTVYQVKNVTSQKTIVTVPPENRGAIFNHNLIIQSGGNPFIKDTLTRGLRSVSAERVAVIQRGAGNTLPDIKSGSALEGFKRGFVEGVADFFKNPDQVALSVETPGTRKGKLEPLLKYPLDMDTNLQDFLQIAIFRYVPGKIPKIDQATDQSRFARQDTRKEEAREIIQIPIPNAIADSNAVNWGGGQMTSTSGTASEAVVESLMGQGTLNKDFGEFDAFGNLISSTGEALGTALKDSFIRRRFIANKISKAVAGLGVNIDVDQAITRIGGVIENPNLELLFTGPALRTFQFSVRFSPRNKDESIRVRKIIRVLKERSAVKKGVTFSAIDNSNSSNLLLGTPDVFRLQYRKAGSRGFGIGSDIKGLNKFKTCALTNISVDYTGGEGRYAAYSLDSQPITTVVTLAFAELVPLYDEDYKTGFSDDDVGF